MHNLNVRILGPSSFILTLIQLKKYLKFNPISENLEDNISIILFHVDALQNKIQKNYIDNNKCIKICLGKRKNLLDHFDANLELPATLKEINEIVESTAAKKKFNKNSSIEIKSYFLNKNERKLSKFDEFIILTEKEVQLIDLFFNSKEPISKDNILSSVWNYSAEADTHTVETHIYRLRKKVAEKFMDEKFILSNKNGYYL